MSNLTKDCIDLYIQTKYKGGLINISDLSDFCNQPIWKIYSDLKELESQGKIEIVTRYFCFENHRIPNDSVPFCPDCDLKYSSADIVTAVYVNPIVNQKLNYSV